MATDCLFRENSFLKDCTAKVLGVKRGWLMRSENGTEDIISKRSKVIQELKIDLDELSMSALVKFIQNNPSVLKRPIILNERSFLVGYDEEEIGAFVPPELRNIAKANCGPSCPNFCTCGEVRQEN